MIWWYLPDGDGDYAPVVGMPGVEEYTGTIIWDYEPATWFYP